MADWIPYMTGLPNVPVYELEVQVSAGKLRAATYGRGIWQSDLATGINSTNEVSHEDDAIMVYPNPSNGTLYVQTDGQKELKCLKCMMCWEIKLWK
jgi:hypothetical protein